MTKTDLRVKLFTQGIEYAAGESSSRVDRETGIIRGAKLCTVGEANGHGVHLDQSFIEDVALKCGEYQSGMKCRFGHPAMCNDAIGTYLGRWKNPRVENDSAVADLHLDTPDEEKRNYMLDMAEQNPDMFGTSIVFESGDRYQYTDEGKKVWVDPYRWEKEDREGWAKYDSEKPLYETCKALHACDAVDTPAANDGLFSAETVAGQITEFLDTHPEVYSIVLKHEDKFNDFLGKYKAYKIMKEKGKKPTFLGKLTEKAKKALKAIGMLSHYTDAETTDGVHIRISNAEGEEPKVGDTVSIIAEDGTATEPAPNGAHVINGGDLDGWVITTIDGKISEITKPEELPAEEAPAEQSEEVTPAAQLAVLREEIRALKAADAEKTAQISALKAENEKLLSTPLVGMIHLNEDEETQKGNVDFSQMPWNKHAQQHQHQS